jgi:hypothetical protein
MPAQRNQRSTRPATTNRAGSTTARRGNGGNGTGRRNNRAADRSVELSIGTAIDLVVEDENGDTFGIAVCSLCASILPGSETAQRSHTSWHETVLGIDSRTVR